MIINTLQRNLLIAAAAVIALMLGSEINSEGLEESHWIIATALVAGMLFVAFSTKSKTEKDVGNPPIAAESFGRNKTDEGNEIVAIRFAECSKQWQKFLKSSMVDRSPRTSVKDRSDLAPFLEMTALKLAFANYILVIAHRGPDAGKRADANALRTHAANVLSRRIYQNLLQVAKLLSEAAPPDREASFDVAINHLTEYELLVRGCQKNFMTSTPFPLDPLYAKVDDEANFELTTAADREMFFGIKYRQETGRLLHPQPGMSAD